MYQQVVLFGVMSLALSSAAFAPKTLTDPSLRQAVNTQIEAVREKFKSYPYVWNVPPGEITWDPVLTDNEFLTAMCQHNQDGNYQIPNNCNQFCMCAGGQAYLWTCPGGGTYAPLPDECVYSPSPDQEKCPWKSIWTYPEGVHCETLGEKQFWGNLTFPAVRDELCGEDVLYCNNYEQVGTGKCDPGFRYSKCFLACIEQEVCFRTDLYCYAGQGIHIKHE